MTAVLEYGGKRGDRAAVSRMGKVDGIVVRYQVNDVVVYESYGVFRIDGFCTKKVGGCEREYYVLKPVYKCGVSTAYVPVESEQNADKLRPLPSREEVVGLIDALPQMQAVASLLLRAVRRLIFVIVSAVPCLAVALSGGLLRGRFLCGHVAVGILMVQILVVHRIIHTLSSFPGGPFWLRRFCFPFVILIMRVQCENYVMNREQFDDNFKNKI